MEASELAGMAVGVAVAIATGAATAVGEGAGTAVAELVRTRFAGTERGRAALEGLDTGASPSAQADARNLLRDEIEADPELRRRLEIHLPSSSTSSTHTVGSVVITGSRLSRSTISLGPVTIADTPGTRAFLAVATALLVVLVALGAYGGVRLLNPDDSPGSSPRPASSDAGSGGLSGDEPDNRNERSDGTASPDASGGTDRKDSPLNSSAVVEVTLPDSGSLPAGWEAAQDKKITAGTPSDCKLECTGALYTGSVPFENAGSGESAFFYLQSYGTADRAARRFDALRADKDEHSGGLEPMSLQPLGDRSAAYRAIIVNAERAEAGVLVGTVVAWVTYRTPDDALDPAVLSSFARMLAERAQQAQDGMIPPTAAVES